MQKPTGMPPNDCQSPAEQRPQITGTVVPGHDPYAAFRSRGFSFFTAGNLLSLLGRQMLAVAVEWEIYRRTHSATALGLVGLVFALAIVGLSLPAGHLADRISRKQIILVSQIFSAITSALLALVSWQHLAIPQLSILRLMRSARCPAGNDKPTIASAKTSPTSPSAVAECVRR